jgi:hypothetical protein
MLACSLSSIHISRLIITVEPDTIREGKERGGESCGCPLGRSRDEDGG